MICSLAEALHVTPQQVRDMPATDVGMMLRFYRAREKERNNEIDLEEVDAGSFAQAIGAV